MFKLFMVVLALFAINPTAKAQTAISATVGLPVLTSAGVGVFISGMFTSLTEANVENKVELEILENESLRFLALGKKGKNLDLMILKMRESGAFENISDEELVKALLAHIADIRSK